VTEPDQQTKRYSPEDVRRLQAEFAPVAARYRRHTVIALCGILVLIACIATDRFLSRPILKEEFGTGLILFGIIAAAVLLAPDLTCPGCSNDMDDEPADYCPECGACSVQPRTTFGSASCRTCGKTLYHGPGYKNRRYKIRFCTYCGLKVDDKGL